MNLKSMAWRNLWRRKRRTWITAVSVSFGVLLSVAFTGMGDYSYTNMINSSARMGLGHITVQAPGYNDQPSLEKRIAVREEERQKLLQLAGVENAIGRINGQAMFSSARKTVGGFFYAINPGLDNIDNFYLLSSLVSGETLSASSGRDVVIGYRLAEKLKLSLGKKLVYTATDVNGEIVSDVARVKGIFRTGIDEVDAAAAVFPIDTLRQLLAYGQDEVSFVAVTIHDQRQINQIQAEVVSQLAQRRIEVLSWQRTQPDLAGLINIDRSTNYLLQFLIGLVIAAGILNTLLMSVMERKQEFGVMMAIGMSSQSLFRMVIYESMWIALLGLLLGLFLTTPLYYYLATVGIDLSASMGENYSAGGILLDPVIKIRLYKESLLSILSAVFALTLLSGLYPAWRAGRIPPVESLRTI